MSWRGLVLLCTVVMMSVGGARAQDTALPEQLTLPALLRLINERSPRLAAEQTAIDAAAAERMSAAAYPNPTLSYGRFRPSGGGNTLFDGSRQEQSTLDYPLQLIGQRGARIEAADQGVLAARARMGAAGNEIGLRAAEFFVALQAAQEKLSVLEDAGAEIKRVLDIVSGRLQSGVASRYDLARVDLELAAVNVRIDQGRADRAAQSAGLAALVGAPGWRPYAVGPVAPTALPADATVWRDALAASNPQVQAARREEDVAQAAVKRADRERWPVPILNLGRSWTSEPFGAANFVGVTSEIPLLDTRAGAVAKAQAELRAAQRRREAIEAEAGAELMHALLLLGQRRDALEQLQSKVGNRIAALKQMAEDAYQLGRGSVLELIDATRSRLDARLSEVDLREAIVQQELRIKSLVGKLVE